MRVIGFDTESTDLSASWGHILCCSYVDISTGALWTHRGDEPEFKGRSKIDDGKLCVAIREELEAADIIVGWNSILHDIPLVNARLARVGERPCRLSKDFGVTHIDAMYYAGGASLKVGGRRLDTVAKYFRCENQKTPLDGEIWQLAAAGDTEALDQIQVHCEADVLVLKDLWPHLAPSIKKMTFTLSEVYPFIEQIPSRKADISG